jgi:hypothetical protein
MTVRRRQQVVAASVLGRSSLQTTDQLLHDSSIPWLADPMMTTTTTTTTTT